MIKLSVIFFVIGICVPQGVSFFIGPLLITPTRLLSFYLFFLFVGTFIKDWVRHKELLLVDFLVIGHVGWAFVSMTVNHGIGTGIEAGGLYFVDFFPFYMLGRILGKKPESMRYFIKAVIIAVVVLIPFAWIEAIWGVSLIKMMFGQPTDFFEQRMGLNRVYASFNHPILYGLFVSSLFGVAWYSMKNGRLRLFLILFVGTVPALSSAPLISLFLQSSLVTWDKIMHKFKARWKILVGGFSSVVILLSMISNSGPIKLIISYATFNPGTGWYRIAIWDYGSAEALRHPLFGIGYHDWVRPGWMVISSVDNFWLFTAMKYGFPALLFILMAKVLIVRKLLGKEYRGDQELRKGWLISLTSLIVVGGTVHFWGSSLSMYAALMGLGAALSCQQIRNAEFITGR